MVRSTIIALLVLLVSTVSGWARIGGTPVYSEYEKAEAVLLAGRSQMQLQGKITGQGKVLVTQPLVLKGVLTGDQLVDDFDVFELPEGAQSFLIYLKRDPEGNLVPVNWMFPFVASTLGLNVVHGLWRGAGEDPTGMGLLPRLVAREPESRLWPHALFLVFGGTPAMNEEMWTLADSMSQPKSKDDRRLFKLAAGVQAFGDELLKEKEYLEFDVQARVPDSPSSPRNENWRYAARGSVLRWYGRNYHSGDAMLMSRFALNQSGDLQRSLLGWAAENYPVELVPELEPLLARNSPVELRYHAMRCLTRATKSGFKVVGIDEFRKDPEFYVRRAREAAGR